MNSVDTDILGRPVFEHNGNRAVLADRFCALGYLVIFREIGVEVMLTSEKVVLGDLTIRRKTNFNRVLYYLLIKNRQSARMPGAYLTDACVWFAALDAVWAAAKDLAGGGELYVDFDAYNSFVCVCQSECTRSE